MKDSNKFIEEAKQNAQTISSELRELSSIEVTSSESFACYRDKSQRVIELFKNLKPLLKEDRENLWNKYQQISNNHRQKQEERKKNRIYASTRKKEVVISTIRDARTYADGDFNSLRRAEDLLKTANEQMRTGWSSGFGVADGLFNMTDGKMTKEDLEYCWQYWNEAKAKINSRRKEIFSNNYDYAREDLNAISDLAVYGDPFEALRRIKTTRGKVLSHPMNRENKQSLLNSLDEWWSKANERIKERKKEQERKQKEWELRKAEREKKQKEWEARKAERERKQKEWEIRKAEREKKQREWELRKVERERKQREWEARKIERERKQREWEERQRERERKNIEWQERKLERERERARKQQEWEERKRNRGSRGRSSGGCYITTATCSTLNKGDNCYELNAIRQFRDKWLSIQKDGKKIISEYYEIAPKIVISINLQNDRRQIYENIWDNYLVNFYKLIIAGKNKKAKLLYLTMVNDLKTRYLSK